MSTDLELTGVSRSLLRSESANTTMEPSQPPALLYNAAIIWYTTTTVIKEKMERRCLFMLTMS
jgi:hypothetical protein